MGVPEILIEVGRFFSMLAVVTFGGAYAVLAYMAQDAVVQFGWLEAGEMVDALGLAETTPGPLILVTQFVGFLAGFKQGGLLLGLGAALVALWVNFAPCFLWIFAGAPYIEWISNQPRLSNALKAITAAVVGVMLNLSIWFSLHVLFTDVSRHSFGIFIVWWPELAGLDVLALFLFLLSAILAFAFNGALSAFYFAARGQAPPTAIWPAAIWHVLATSPQAQLTVSDINNKDGCDSKTHLASYIYCTYDLLDYTHFLP